MPWNIFAFNRTRRHSAILLSICQLAQQCFGSLKLATIALAGFRLAGEDMTSCRLLSNYNSMDLTLNLLLTMQESSVSNAKTTQITSQKLRKLCSNKPTETNIINCYNASNVNVNATKFEHNDRFPTIRCRSSVTVVKFRCSVKIT